MADDYDRSAIFSFNPETLLMADLLWTTLVAKF